MSKKITFREMSETNWSTTFEDEKSTWPGYDRINCGSLQRIADATEKMASNYTRMENDLAWYKRQYANQQAEIQYLKNSRAGYMAALTKLRNKIENGDV